MSGVDERQQLLNLPLPERTIAVALKQVFDQIKKIEEEEAQEIQKVHQSFIGQFKEGETKVIIHSLRPAKSSKADQSKLRI